MEFLKKHYEKILLSVVLLGLIVVAAWLPMMVKDAEKETAASESVQPKAQPIPALNFDKELKALQTITNPQPLILSGEHKLVNPVTWKAKPDGTLFKVLVEGPEAMSIKGIRPQYTIISFDRSGGTGYYMSLQQQSGRKNTEFLKTGEKSKSGLFTLREVKGTPEDPSEVVIELSDTQEVVSVTKQRPYQRVDSYTVDMKYDPENKTFAKQKVNDSVTFAGETYKIVYITNNEVRVTANQTGKQTTINWTGTP